MKMLPRVATRIETPSEAEASERGKNQGKESPKKEEKERLGGPLFPSLHASGEKDENRRWCVERSLRFRVSPATV